MVERVVATTDAIYLIKRIKGKYESIFFYQSGGCCDGSVPMCYQMGDFPLGDQDVYLGTIEEVPFYMHKRQYDYWKHTQLIIDAIDGQGPAFSLDSLEDRHFITKSKVFTAAEYQVVIKNGK